MKNAEAAKALHMEQDGNGLEKQGAQIYNSQKRKKYASKETESETFESSPREKKRKRMESASVQSSLKISIMFDGGSRGNPGIGGAGALVTITSKTDGSSTDFETRKIRVRHYLGRSTNNEAEYCGLCQGLETVLREVKQLKSSSKDIKEPSAVDTKLKVDLIVQGDSQLVIKQIKKEYKCNQPSLRVYLAKVRSLIDEIGQFCELKADFEHVLREFNSVADGTYRVRGEKGLVFGLCNLRIFFVEIVLSILIFVLL